jgi:hypothetical protein
MDILNTAMEFAAKTAARLPPPKFSPMSWRPDTLN